MAACTGSIASAGKATHAIFHMMPMMKDAPILGLNLLVRQLATPGLRNIADILKDTKAINPDIVLPAVLAKLHHNAWMFGLDTEIYSQDTAELYVTYPDIVTVCNHLLHHRDKPI